MHLLINASLSFAISTAHKDDGLSTDDSVAGSASRRRDEPDASTELQAAPTAATITTTAPASRRES
jgi:hypothetical protein